MAIQHTILARYGNLQSRRGTWENHWQEIADLVFPNHATFIGIDEPGTKRTLKMYDSTPVHASEVLAAGFHGRMTNPASEWFGLKFDSKELNDSREAALWLSEVQDIMYKEMRNAKTAFTSHMNELYLEYSVFGNGVLFIGENAAKDGVLYQAISLSDGFIAENQDGVIDTLYRRMSMTVSQVVAKFGLDKVSKRTKDKFAAKKVDDLVMVIHAVEPRAITGFKAKLRGKLPFISIYVEEDQKTLLRESGFDSFPYATPRYYKAAGEVYARGPAVTALPDIKMLNTMMKTTIAAAEKIVDPALQVPDNSFLGPVRTLPGGLNFYRAGSKERIEPIQTGGNVPLGLEIMEEIRNRIRQVFFNDQMQLGHRPEMTATEVIQRTEDMLRMMGPILGRMQSEGLNIIIDRTFDVLWKQNKFPQPPDIIDDGNIEIIYTSPIAKAQRQLEAGGLQRVLESMNIFISQDPTILQRFDTDELLDLMIDLFGVRPSVLRPQEEVEAEKKAQESAIASQQEVETFKTGSEAGLNLARMGDISGAG